MGCAFGSAATDVSAFLLNSARCQNGRKNTWIYNGFWCMAGTTFQRGRKKIRCKFHNFRCKKWLRKRQKKDKIYNGIFSVAGVWLRKQHTTTETILDDFCGQEKTAKLKKYCFSRWKWPSRCKFCCPQKNPVVKKSFFFESKKRAVSKCH